MILLDTSATLQWLDGRLGMHGDVREVMEAQTGPFIMSPFVLAELDYMLRKWVGVLAQRDLLEEVQAGVYQLAEFSRAEVGVALELIRRYSALKLSLADASIVVLAERYGAGDVLTLDQRHFRVLPGPGGRPFRILPADA